MTSSRSDHYLLDGLAGWRNATLDHLVIAGDGASIQLQPLPGTACPLVDATGSFGGLALPTGLAVDAAGNIYILDRQAHAVRRFDPCAAAFTTLPCIGGIGSAARQLRRPNGIAISRRGDLYIADSGNRRVQIFALKGLPLRQVWGPLRVRRTEAGPVVEPVAPERSTSGQSCEIEERFPAGTWEPWDLALDDNCCAFVSDYANGLVHMFDSRGRWLRALDGAGEHGPALERPTHIAVDQEGRVYVVQEGKDYVAVLDGCSGATIAQLRQPDQVAGRFCPLAIAVDREGNLYLTEKYTRRVYIYCAGQGAAPHTASVCQAFCGIGTALAFDSSGNPLLADALGAQIVRLEHNTAYVSEGRYISMALDSGMYRCQWHRIVICSDIPPGTHLRVATFTSEAPRDLSEIAGLPEDRWSEAALATGQIGECERDAMVLSPPGRYLWLRLIIAGDGAATASVCRVKMYYPRESSLQYLPAVYSEDAVSRDFLGRFLSIFDTMRASIADTIGEIARYFDPVSTPAGPGQSDFLSWLAAWLGLTLDRRWSEAQRRRLVQQAYLLYRLRGTPAGLRLAIELYTGMPAQILEHFKLRRWLFVDHGRLGDQSALWGTSIVARLQLDEYARIGDFQLIDSGDPLRDPFHQFAHRFTVFVPRGAGMGEDERRALERVVALVQPAHTEAELRLVEPRFRIGVQAFIGIDTVVARYPEQVIAGEGALGYDTVLGPSQDEAAAPTIRVGIRSRIGSSTLID